MAFGCLPLKKFERVHFLLLFAESHFLLQSNSIYRESFHYHVFLGLEAAPCFYFIWYYLMYSFCMCSCSHACTCVCAQLGGHRTTGGAIPQE